jgi:tetratricopeptide (TPR) repeat protein
MNLITAKCPDCGADLKIPEGSTNVTCEYCGSNILVTDVLGSNAVMQNCMTLAYAALKSEDYKEAYDHFNRALETDMKSSGAWFGKALCAGELGKVANPRFDEMMTMFETAINYAQADKQNNLKKNAAAEVVKCVRHITPNIKFGEQMLELEMGVKDADFAASTADITANLKKAKEEITRALQKAHEYDPANNDVTALITEVNTVKSSDPNSGSGLHINQDFADVKKKLSEVQEPAPVQTAPVSGAKKSGCSFMIAALIFIISACVVFYFHLRIT